MAAAGQQATSVTWTSSGLALVFADGWSTSPPVT
jgi:hypothetical protein